MVTLGGGGRAVFVYGNHKRCRRLNGPLKSRLHSSVGVNSTSERQNKAPQCT